MSVLGDRRVWRRMAFLVLAVLLAVPAHGQEEVNPQALRQYNLAVSLQNKKLYPQAAKNWQAFIKAYPKDEKLGHAWHYLGICQLQEKQYDEAAKSFQMVLAQFPKFPSRDASQLNLALSLYNKALSEEKPEQLPAAAAAFAELPAKYADSPHAPAALFYQAECLYSAGDVEKAVPAYQALIGKYKESELLPDAYYALGTAQQDLEQYPAAAETFAAFVKNYPEHPLVTECRLRQGMALFADSKLEEAEKLFAQTAAVADFGYADFALLRQAECRFELKQLDQAAALYQQLVQKFPESAYKPAALLSAGKCQYLQEKYPEAQALLQQTVALKSEQESPEAAYWLGRTLIKLVKPAEAVQTLDAAIAAFDQSEALPRLQYCKLDAQYEIPEQREAAVAGYLDFATKQPEHELAANALYMAALGSLVLEKQTDAVKHAEAFLANQKFAEHELTPEVLYIAAEGHVQGHGKEIEGADLAKAEAYYRRLATDFAEHRHSPSAQIRTGLCLYLQDKYEPAVAHLTQVAGQLKEPEQLAEAWLWIGRAQSDADKSAEAVAALEKARQAAPQWQRGDEVLLALAVNLRAEDQLDVAQQRLAELLNQFQESPLRDEALFQQAEVSYEQDKLDEAIARYRQLVEGFPESELAPLAAFGIGSTLYDKKEYSTAAEALGTLLQKYPQAEITPRGRYVRGLAYQQLKQFQPAVTDLQAFLQSQPKEQDALDARYALALCQVGLEQHAPAIQTLAAILQEKPDYAKADAVYYEMAFAQLASDQPEAAVKTFQELASKLPDSPLASEGWFRVGQYHKENEKFDEAIKAFTAGLAMAKEPSLKEKLQYELGGTYYQMKDYEKAAQSFAAQLNEHPEGEYVIDAAYLGGDSLLEAGQYEQALPLLVKVVAAKPERYHARALYRCGMCTAQLKQWPQSQQYLDTLIKAFPKYELLEEARYQMGHALQQQNKLAEAKQVYEQVTAATDTETGAKARFMIGECCFAEKAYDQAIEHFLKVAVGYPYKEWQALGHLEAARCFIELKQNEAAIDSLQTVIKDYPESPKVPDAQKLLASLSK